MTSVIIVIHLLLAIVLVGLVLMQKSEGGMGSMGGGGSSGSGGMGGFMSVRGTANLLTRATGVLAALFMVSSMTLAILSDSGRDSGSILDQTPPPAQPIVPSAPSVPQLPTAPNPPQN